ncbi:DUF6984 family protein [Stenotrophomonas rhizophila]|uniref:DUF6984 family protein n=1 Tax=Stenotrophomonas rhizophila TaxID=216778 RepID=UPI001E5048D5|nr:hypothetical protein [Stenotrophomonas rhizophila]MCC7633393.1 hypothetical protein [Stenotrophomonas rhizophila]MCC7663121.1 hypothetical protein [Stenotrophomonas rhizophila]
MMRKISELERILIEGVSEKMSPGDASKLLADMVVASATDVSLDGSRVIFSLEGYESPVYDGQHQFPVEIRLLDSDAGELTAVLYADSNGRLYELELIRWDGKPLVSPDLATLKFY